MFGVIIDKLKEIFDALNRSLFHLFVDHVKPMTVQLIPLVLVCLLFHNIRNTSVRWNFIHLMLLVFVYLRVITTEI